MSIISAVRITLRVAQAGEQQGLILHKGKHVAHHIAAAGRLDLGFHVTLHQNPGVQDTHYLVDRHLALLPSLF